VSAHNVSWLALFFIYLQQKRFNPRKQILSILTLIEELMIVLMQRPYWDTEIPVQGDAFWEQVMVLQKRLNVL
jgi:hypothetical protein